MVLLLLLSYAAVVTLLDWLGFVILNDSAKSFVNRLWVLGGVGAVLLTFCYLRDSIRYSERDGE